MTFIDFFAGIGGFRRGMEMAGHKCVGFCEWDKYAVMSYTSMHLITEEQREYLATLDMKKRQKEILKEEYRNGEWYSADIRDVHAGAMPMADCWCFGAPCQDFSVAGHRKGLEGDRSSLVREVFRIIGETREEDRPEWLIYENVKGMLSSNRGFDFLAILLEMDRGGYDTEWFLFNSKYHGVPQNRERVYTVGHLRSRGAAKIFPIKGTDGEDCVHGIRQIGGVLKESRNNPSVYRVYDTDGLSPTLTDMAGGGREPHTIEVIGHDARRTIHDTDRVLGEGGVLPLPLCEGLQRTTESGVIVVGNTNPSGKGMNGNCYFSEGVNPAVTCNKHEGNRVAIPVLTPDRAYKRQNGRRFKEDGEESFTLTAQDRHGVAVSVVPMELSGYELSEAGSEAHSLNCSDQRKVFGAHQKRTMVGYNATLKRGGGTTNIARALSARDYKGLSGSEQMMTTAAYLLSTKDTDQKNEKSQTVSKQGRTESCQKEGRKER